ncbi:hypothetical protein N7539_003904 [Penicillium diatomitis]|uniref:PH domain protein n=1 Tax=Penicillium diatomitis TaxID=2819901 RepID=A0A9X0BY03_9EURO|nr:uncharacterized protein N7539_003904 [Penicillium diatomitis]KAJ5489014.1 hypothetical protein N7539_003904 [Penicillium diatomitis]
MSGLLWSVVGKRVLAESARNHFGTEDPYFEEVPASRLGQALGKKTQKRRKAIPPGLSEKDGKILTQVKRRAYRLDYALFNLCGIRFGWGSVIGLVPFVGDAADAALALMVVKSCEGIDGGLPQRLRMMMMINVMIDFVIGLVPFIGDVADAVYKCNTRNAVLLEKHLREKGAKTIKAHVPRENLPAAGGRPEARVIDHSLPDEWDRQESGTVEELPPQYTEQTMSGTQAAVNAPQQPARPARVKKDRDGGRSKKWFGGSREPDSDLERGR